MHVAPNRLQLNTDGKSPPSMWARGRLGAAGDRGSGAMKPCAARMPLAVDDAHVWHCKEEL